jgi:phage terminase small subunit
MAKKPTKPPAAVKASKKGKALPPVRVSPETGLTDQQEKFCREYLLDFNATRAAIAAGYATKSAAAQGSRLLTNEKIAKFLGVLQKPTLDQYEITNEKIMREVAICAFSNMGDYTRVTAQGQIISDFSTVTREQLGALAQVEITEMEPVMAVTSEGLPFAREVVKVKIKTVDKLAALEKLMRRAGLIKEEVVVTHKADISMVELARRMAYMLSQSSREVSPPPPPAS